MNKTMEERILEQLNAINQTGAISFVALAESGTIPEDTALEHKELFTEWTSGVAYKVGQIRKYNDMLYKVRQVHTSEADKTPDMIPALWSAINKTNAGTIDDPIPAVANMEYVKGLYYIENGVIYLMNRQGMAEGESIVLDYLPSQLIGLYFEKVE